MITLLFQSGILFVNSQTSFGCVYDLLHHSTFVITNMFAELNLKLSLKLKLPCEFLIPLVEEAL